MLPPDFDHDLRLCQSVEDFTVQQFIAQFLGGLGSDSGNPFPKSNGDELRAIVCIEYGLIAAGISIAIVAVVQSRGTKLASTFTSVKDALP